MKRLVNTWIDKCLNQWQFEDYVSQWMNTELLFHPESSSRFRACLFISKIYISVSSHSLTRIVRTTNPVGGYSGSSLDHSGLCEHVITQWPATFHGGSMERVMDSRVQENLAMFSSRSTKVIGESLNDLSHSEALLWSISFDGFFHKRVPLSAPLASRSKRAQISLFPSRGYKASFVAKLWEPVSKVSKLHSPPSFHLKGRLYISRKPNWLQTWLL